MPKPPLYPGYTARERASSPYARFFRPDLAPLPAHVQDALLTGARPPALLPGVEAAAALHDPGYWPVETGYTFTGRGAAHVFALTRMPGVTPAMWDWWFGWHGSDPLRYKLWHPQSHLHVGWADGGDASVGYVGRTSRVVELVGTQQRAFSIRFVRPLALGLDESLLAARGEVAVCAFAGLTGLPADGGAMIHHLRPTAEGCEMRSRFWLAGSNVRLHGLPRPLGGWLGALAGFIARPSERDARELLVHCAQEMNHLAAILPDLHAACAVAAPDGDAAPARDALPLAHAR